MPESDLQEMTRQMLGHLRDAGEILEFFHPYHMMRARAGWPDWCIVIRKSHGVPLIIWIELKSAKGKLTKEQKQWGEALGKRFHVARTLDEFAEILKSHGVRVRLV